MESPNRTKLFILGLCDENFISISELANKIADKTGFNIQTNSASALMSQLKKPILKPFYKILEKTLDDKGYSKYRIFPPAVKIKSADLFQLSKNPGSASYSIHDAMREVPEIAEFFVVNSIKPENDPPLKKKAAPTSKRKNPAAIADESQKKFLPPDPDKMADDFSGITYKKDAIPQAAPQAAQSLDVNIKISFGAVRILFGFDK